MQQSMVVIEDDMNIREMLSFYFKSVGFNVSAFETGEDYFDVIPEIVPSIFIIDIMLPKMDGYAILDRLRSTRTTMETPVILLTARTSEADRVRGLMAGGDDYVVKPFGIMELQARVNAVLRRSRDCRAEFEYRDLVICPESRTVTCHGRALDLTHKEFDLLCLLIKNRGHVLSREEILSAVWDYSYVGKTRTVDMHIKSLRAKLGEAPDGSPYIVTVHGCGYKVD